MRSAQSALRETIAHLSHELDVARERIATLENREWQRYEMGDRPVMAMPAPGPDPHEGYVYQTDDTGLVGEWVRVHADMPE